MNDASLAFWTGTPLLAAWLSWQAVTAQNGRLVYFLLLIALLVIVLASWLATREGGEQ